MGFIYDDLPTPCYVVDEKKLIDNLEVLKMVMEKTGCKILLAQKAFSMYSLYPTISKYLSGTTASGIYEARLAHEHFDGENHVFAPAYKEDEFHELIKICSHIVFNSFNQWRKYGPKALKAGCSCGIRINPECSTQKGQQIYDPCAPKSRLGVTIDNFYPEEIEGLEGIHMHTLCEQNSDDLVTTLKVAEEKFGLYMGRMKWINLGGGHHITREDYDIDTLISEIIRIKEKYQVEVYLEPGEAVVLNSGFLISSVLEIVHNQMDIAILDTSATCHMPDVLEVPYRPEVIGAGLASEKKYTYRLAGPTCLAGDIIGDYSFDRPLKEGDKLVFCDMAHYTMVKNNTFNGMPLPAIAIRELDGVNKIVKKFDYEDFKERLS